MQLMRADDTEAFLGEYADDRGKQAIVIAGERSAADSSQQLGALGIRPQVQQRGPADRTDHHQVLAAMRT